jgi:hypothetical protein
MSLHPEIRHLLSAFQHRRKVLLIWRAALSSTLILIGLGSLLAALDWNFVLPDSTRLALSASLYLLALANLLYRGIKPLRTPESLRALATRIESNNPSPHRTFLSAVELALNADNASAASPEFLQKIQAQGLASAGPNLVQRCLPLNRLRPEFTGAIASLLGLALLLLFSKGAFLTPLLRTLAPFAPIERPSLFKITLLQPSLSESLAPENEKLTVEVSLSGPNPASPTLEYSGADGRSTLPMTPAESGHFTAQLPLGKSPCQFTIRAANALSPKFLVRPTPRPAAVLFEKTIQPPVYAGLPETTTRSENGDLQAIFGSSASIRVELNESVRSASLVLHHGEKTETVPIALKEASRSLRFQMPIDDSASYHLELLSASTGFQSLPFPRHEIRAQSDQPPTLTLDSPSEDLTLPLGQSVRIRARASDDLGLVDVHQKFQINEGPWRDLPSATVSGTHYELQQTWDPLQQGAKPGDVLLTQWIAVDSLGQVAESRTLRLVLLHVQGDPEMAHRLAMQRLVLEHLQSLQTNTRDASTALSEFRSQNDSRSPDLIRRDQSVASARQFLAEAAQQVAQARTHLSQALRDTAQDPIGSGLQDLAHLLNRIQFSHLALAQESFQASVDSPTSSLADRREASRIAAESVAAAVQQTSLAIDALKPQLALEEAASVTIASEALAAEQKAIEQSSHEQAVSTAQNPPPSERPPGDMETGDLRRRQRINEAAVRTLQAELLALSDRAASQPLLQERLKGLRDELQKPRLEVEKSLVMDEPLHTSRQNIQQLAAALQKTAHGVKDLTPLLAQAAEKAREQLSKAHESTAALLEKTAHELQRLANRNDVSSDLKRTILSARSSAEAAVVQAEATLRSSSESSEARWAADLNTAARALRSSASQPMEPETGVKRLADLSRTLRPLEADARLDVAFQKAEALAAPPSTASEPGTHADPLPQNNPKTLNSRSPEKAREARDLQRALDGLSRDWNKAPFPEEARTQLKKSLESDPARRIRSPQTSPAPETSLRQDASQLAETLREIKADVAETVRLARLELEGSAPSVSEEFKQLAAQASLSSQRSSTLSQALENAPLADNPKVNPAEPVNELQKQESQQARRIAGAKESLLQQANQQDLRTEAGRQRARDTDAANALLKDSEKASDSLQKAAESKDPSTQSGLLKETATQQNQLAKQLEKIADLFEQLEKQDPAGIARSRKALRDAEREMGLSKSLDAFQKHSEELAQLGQLAQTSTEEAQKKLQELLQNSGSRADRRNQTDSPSKPGSLNRRETAALQKALDSLRSAAPNSGAPPSETTASLAEAAKANQDQQRNNRLQKSARDSSGSTSAPPGSAIDGEAQDGPGIDALPELQHSASGDWGKLPKRLAKDLMEGKREPASGEYQSAIESYFRAIAEKAQGRPQ